MKGGAVIIAVMAITFVLVIAGMGVFVFSTADGEIGTFADGTAENRTIEFTRDLGYPLIGVMGNMAWIILIAIVAIVLMLFLFR